jgi:hypothetical protein
MLHHAVERCQAQRTWRKLYPTAQGAQLPKGQLRELQREVAPVQPQPWGQLRTQPELVEGLQHSGKGRADPPNGAAPAQFQRDCHCAEEHKLRVGKCTHSVSGSVALLRQGARVGV